MRQQNISWHSFRHTHATLLNDLGESLKTARAQLGLSTTAEIYTHAVPASQRAAVEKLEKAIWTTQLDPNGPKSEGSKDFVSKFFCEMWHAQPTHYGKVAISFDDLFVNLRRTAPHVKMVDNLKQFFSAHIVRCCQNLTDDQIDLPD